VVNRYNIGAVIFPKLVDKTKNYDAFLRVLKNKKIPVVFAAAGQIIAREQIKLTILAPDEKLLTWGKGNMNSAAIVVKAELPGYSLLLTGDIEAPTENYLVNKIGKTLAADILKVGHHGSKTSTSVSLLDAVKPKMAIISVAAKNMFGHPHPLTLKRLQGIGVERTDQMGTITLESSVKTGEIKLRCDKKCAL
jgi:competence protein ComEC